MTEQKPLSEELDILCEEYCQFGAGVDISLDELNKKKEQLKSQLLQDHEKAKKWDSLSDPNSDYYADVMSALQGGFKKIKEENLNSKQKLTEVESLLSLVENAEGKNVSRSWLVMRLQEILK